MTKKAINFPKKIIVPVIILLIFAAAALLQLFGAFDYLEYKTYDLRVRLMAGYTRPSDDIMVILLDQNSIDWGHAERGWSWPWPRSAYAELVDYMNTGKAASVVFDVIFSEPSVYGDEDDQAFIEASKNFGRVVQTVFFSSQSGKTLAWPENIPAPLFEPRAFDPLLPYYDPAREDPDQQIGVQLPIEGLLFSAGAAGNITGRSDSDSVFRRVSPFVFFDGRAVPALSAASLLAAGKSSRISYNAKKQRIEWEDYTIPVDKNGRALLRFRGDLNRYIPYSAADVLQSAESYRRGASPLLPPEDFSGKYVFFGYNAPGLFDIFSTPISSVYPGVGVHLAMLDNLLQGDFIRESSALVNMLMILAAVACTSLIAFFSKRILPATGGFVLIVILILGLGIGAYHFANFWLPVAGPLAGIFTAFLVAALYNYATEGSQKRFIKSAFSQYLSPIYIEQLIANPEQLKLGGEKREMSAIFTDVRSFSTISEALDDPEKLVELLNFYLTKMSNVVLENQGTIDKYEGDAIIAFFGAPIHMENHADLACRSAVLMKKAEAELNREAVRNGLITGKVIEALKKKGVIMDSQDPAPLYTRIGINSGDMVVGNMGTPNKMDYTIMGNNVNLAARLEGVNKQYNTGGILISEYTRDKIGDAYILRSLDRVRVVGIDTPLRLYELLDLRESASRPLLDMTGLWEQAVQSYEKQDFAEAGVIFKNLCSQNDRDLTAKLYLERCEMYLKTPPDKNWDAINNLTQK
ncbi:MAG: adenylate/guanylate cyclase domain-containing protein [Treponema sp.]|jgi:adenylate cyclase|nr:adenylate/guanylate cyclase domain-containing protein [Treponema sp.]